jgi:hypothetical protein
MIKKVTKIEKLEACPHQFTRHEFIVSDDIRTRVENEIRELTSNFTLSDIRDKGRMIKLTSDEINTFRTNGGSLQESKSNVEEHFGHLYRHAGLDDINNRPDECEQVTRYIPNFPSSLAEIISNEMTEVVNTLQEHTDDPYAYIVITNAPIEFPFGQKNDTQYRHSFPEEKIEDRHPTAEAFQYGLLQASGHTIDCPFPGRAFAPVTPDIKMIGDDKNSLLEELSSTQSFSMHIDGANYNHYSSLVCLAYGTESKFSETVFAHTEAIFDQLDEMDKELGFFNNGMGRRDVLSLDVFEHGPGTYSTCMNVVKSPIFFKSYDHIVKPRINLINGRTRILTDKLSDFSITNEEVLEAIRGLNQASQNIKNILPKKIKAGQVLCISGELLHARSAFSVNKKNPRYAIRLRGTSKKEYLLLENLKKTKNVSNELEYTPGV